MKTLKVIDSIIQIGFIISVLIMLKSETLTSTLLITYLFLGPYQVLSQFLHFLFYKRTKLRKVYMIGAIIFFLGLCLFFVLFKLPELNANMLDMAGIIYFYLATSLLAIFYIYITFKETYEEIGK